MSTAVSRPVPGTVTTKVGKVPESNSSNPLVGLIPTSLRGIVSGGSSSRKLSETSSSGLNSTGVAPSSERKSYRVYQFERILEADNVDLQALRKIAWNGVPVEFRPMVWQLLLGYLPTNKNRRDGALGRKRQEYIDSVLTF